MHELQTTACGQKIQPFVCVARCAICVTGVIMEQSVSVSYKLSLEARYTLGNLLSASYINNVVCNSIKYAKCKTFS